MVRRNNGRPIGLLVLVVLAALVVAWPVAAQSTGMVKGVVTDDRGQPVEGAAIIIEMTGGTGRRFESKSNKKGEFIQIGLSSGSYKVTAEKDKLGSAPVTVTVRVNQTADANLVLGVASAAASKEAAAKMAEMKTLFTDGVALSSSGKHAEALEKFNAAAAINPNCNDCYDNIGFSYAQMKDYDKAEAAYKKAAELKPDDSAAYAGLATVYNAQRKFDQAAAASTKATELAGSATAGGGAGSADALYNQAVILFNQGKSDEAKPILEKAVAANPDHADSHYLLGMVFVGTDPSKAVAEFETYLKLAPSGPADKVKMAQDVVTALKK